MNSEQKDKFYAGLMRGLIRVLKHVPLETTGHLFDFAGRCAYFFLPKKRRDGYWSMRIALAGQLSEDQRRNELRAQFRHLARNLGEVLTFEQLTKEEILKTIDIEGWERIENALNSGRGVVLITGHYGNWELMQIYSGLRGRPIHVLGRDQKFPRLNEILIQQRQVHGSVAVSRGMNMRFLMKALKEGNVTGMLGDESAGRAGGILLPFFGKVTTVPTGGFDLAVRTNAVVLPCFMMRIHNRRHYLCIDSALPDQDENKDRLIETQAKAYISRLEEYISRSPRQWLWQNKRWKYSWTRSIVVLSDRKPGHFKQSQAVASIMAELDEYHGRKGLSFQTQKVEIDYHSALHAKLFFAVGWLLLPFIRGRMNMLRLFVKEPSLEILKRIHADFIFAAGSSLAPLQHLFAAETGAKKVVMMTPPVPYRWMGYDLAVVPAHDPKILKHTFQTLISPSGYGSDKLAGEAAQFAAELKGSGAPEFAVFVGGKTRDFDVSEQDAEKLLSILDRAADKIGGYVLTTSRRTTAATERVFAVKEETPELCCRRVIAREDTRSVVAKGMLGLAKRLIVTEDSLAMISEAVATGKPVIVLKLHSEKLPFKHRRFLENLENQKAVIAADLDHLEHVLSSPVLTCGSESVLKEKNALKEALRRLL